MPRRGAAALLLTTAALALLLSFKTPAQAVPVDGLAVVEGATAAPAGTAPAATAPAATSAPAAATPADGTPTATPTPAAPTDAATPAPIAVTGSYRDGTVTGDAVGIRWGTVQVQVTIANGQIVDVTALSLPAGDPHSAQLSQRAEPALRSSALSSQSAAIDVVSGATYTSMAYAQSLQAALDAARA